MRIKEDTGMEKKSTKGPKNGGSHDSKGYILSK